MLNDEDKRIKDGKSCIPAKGLCKEGYDGHYLIGGRIKHEIY